MLYGNDKTDAEGQHLIEHLSRKNLDLLSYVPLAIMALIGAMLIGMVGHGTELFYRVEGGKFNGDWTTNIFPAIKAIFFPLAFECGNAVGLFVLFHKQCKGWWVRFTSGSVGLICLATSFLIQYHYYQGKTEADFWYSGVLPALVGCLSALAGLLDRKVNENVKPPVANTNTVNQEKQLLYTLVNQLEVLGNNQQTAASTLSTLQQQLANTDKRLGHIDNWIANQLTLQTPPTSTLPEMLDMPELPSANTTLPDWQRKALEMYQTGNYTQQQIAEAVGKSRFTVNQFLKAEKSA